MLADFLSPFWEWLFDKFGVFGMMIATSLPILFILLVVVVLAVIVMMVKKSNENRKNKKIEEMRKEAREFAENRDYGKAFFKWMDIAEMASLTDKEEFEISTVCRFGKEMDWGLKEKRANEAYWLERAAKQNNADAIFRMGEIKAVKENLFDIVEGLELFRKAEKLGSKQAQNILKGLPEIYEKAGMNETIVKAVMGDGKALYSVAYEAYRKADQAMRYGVPEWFIWLRKSAEKGYAMAQLEYGELLYFGKEAAEKIRCSFHVEDDSKIKSQNPYDGIDWMCMAARQGTKIAQYALVETLSEHGSESVDELKEAIEWYGKCMDEQDTFAMRYMGNMYLRLMKAEVKSLCSNGMSRSEAANRYDVMEYAKESYCWHKMAAELGDQKAQAWIDEFPPDTIRNYNEKYRSWIAKRNKT